MWDKKGGVPLISLPEHRVGRVYRVAQFVPVGPCDSESLHAVCVHQLLQVVTLRDCTSLYDLSRKETITYHFSKQYDIL